MTTYAALLRGINVGGHRKVPMADLRQLLEDLGYENVRTYLQSGNAVFSTGAVEPDGAGGANGAGAPTGGDGPGVRSGAAVSGDTDAVTAALGRAVEDRFGFSVEILVRDHGYLRALVEDCPFPAATLEGRQLHVTYLSENVDEDRFAALDRAAFLPEEFRVGDHALYLYVPDGLGRSRLADALAKPALWKGVVATSRNWNTVTRLMEMTRD
ncbi:DUF1697 domain-containing protein [Streptomyces uncialis]|uniref:DUF1697 domain-containing protein n=1 Tax=Streptomyces uncialis TaxID=1048205 RepID=UPI0038190FF2